MTIKSQKIDIPTLIIIFFLGGEEDKVISVKNAYAFHKNIENSQLVILDGIGHMPIIEEPKTTTIKILEFIN